MTNSKELGPADFAPYRAEINLCECATCRDIAYALSSVLDGPGSRRHRDACVALLDSLRAGTHRRMTLAERAAEARVEQAERLARAIAGGASAASIEAIRRGYATVKMSDFYASGMGIGIGPRRGVAVSGQGIITVVIRDTDRDQEIVHEHAEWLEAARDISAARSYINLQLTAVRAEDPATLDRFREYCSKLAPSPVTWEV